VAQPGDPTGAAELVDAILASSASAARLRGALSRGEAAPPEVGSAPVQFGDVFPATPDRRVHLVPEDLDREAPGGLYAFRPDSAQADFPLALISPATDRTISSTLGQLHRAQVPLEIHPQDARRRGIPDGAVIRVWNAQGEVRCTSRWNSDLREGVVLLSKGLWSHNTVSGSTATALAPDDLTDLGGGACFNDARVEVEIDAR
jgi:anaerobic selenocysteine-containing dehydrogenase